MPSLPDLPLYPSVLPPMGVFSTVTLPGFESNDNIKKRWACTPRCETDLQARVLKAVPPSLCLSSGNSHKKGTPFRPIRSRSRSRTVDEYTRQELSGRGPFRRRRRVHQSEQVRQQGGVQVISIGIKHYFTRAILSSRTRNKRKWPWIRCIDYRSSRESCREIKQNDTWMLLLFACGIGRFGPGKRRGHICDILGAPLLGISVPEMVPSDCIPEHHVVEFSTPLSITCWIGSGGPRAPVFGCQHSEHAGRRQSHVCDRAGTTGCTYTCSRLRRQKPRRRVVVACRFGVCVRRNCCCRCCGATCGGRRRSSLLTHARRRSRGRSVSSRSLTFRTRKTCPFPSSLPRVS